MQLSFSLKSSHFLIDFLNEKPNLKKLSFFCSYLIQFISNPNILICFNNSIIYCVIHFEAINYITKQTFKTPTGMSSQQTKSQTQLK